MLGETLARNELEAHLDGWTERYHMTASVEERGMIIN